MQIISVHGENVIELIEIFGDELPPSNCVHRNSVRICCGAHAAVRRMPDVPRACACRVNLELIRDSPPFDDIPEHGFGQGAPANVSEANK